jgi:hypothetical protein
MDAQSSNYKVVIYFFLGGGAGGGAGGFFGGGFFPLLLFLPSVISFELLDGALGLLLIDNLLLCFISFHKLNHFHVRCFYKNIIDFF